MASIYHGRGAAIGIGEAVFEELDPAQTFVLLDGFSVAQEEDEDAQSAHFASSFMKSIETCGSFVLVFEPWERPLPLWRAAYPAAAPSW